MPSGRSGSLPHFLRWFSLCRHRPSLQLTVRQPERKLVCHAVYSECCCGWDERSGLWTLGIGAHTCTIARPQSLSTAISKVEFGFLIPRDFCLSSLPKSPQSPHPQYRDSSFDLVYKPRSIPRAFLLSCYRAILSSCRSVSRSDKIAILNYVRSRVLQMSFYS